jgi:hypothetical protein
VIAAEALRLKRTKERGDDLFLLQMLWGRHGALSGEERDVNP